MSASQRACQTHQPLAHPIKDDIKIALSSFRVQHPSEKMDGDLQRLASIERLCRQLAG